LVSVVVIDSEIEGLVVSETLTVSELVADSDRLTTTGVVKTHPALLPLSVELVPAFQVAPPVALLSLISR